jgi:hypothetical protein
MPPNSIVIYVDVDACPVKEEVYRVAERHGLNIKVVTNSFIAVPRTPMIERVIVPAGMDVADDWIAERTVPALSLSPPTFRSPVASWRLAESRSRRTAGPSPRIRSA